MCFESNFDSRQPWEMTLKEFSQPLPDIKPTKPNYILAYHRLADSKHLQSVLKEGLRKTGDEGPSGVMASGTKDGWNNDGILLTIQIPKDTEAAGVDPYYTIYQGVPPEDILYVDAVDQNWERLSNLKTHEYATSLYLEDVRTAIERNKPVSQEILNQPEVIKFMKENPILSPEQIRKLREKRDLWNKKHKENQL